MFLGRRAWFEQKTLFMRWLLNTLKVIIFRIGGFHQRVATHFYRWVDKSGWGQWRVFVKSNNECEKNNCARERAVIKVRTHSRDHNGYVLKTSFY